MGKGRQTERRDGTRRSIPASSLGLPFRKKGTGLSETRKNN